jgi:hypothetical protein
MNTRRFLITLTVVNTGVLLLSIGQHAIPASAQEPVPVLRARALEIVDQQGRVRASLSVVAADTTASGAAYRETVLLRLITEQGRPSVKLSASEQASGLSVSGPTGSKDAYAILEANAISSSLKLRAEDGREQLLKP